jgi:uncharacterized repeat protein (TIGR03803 family)
MIDEHRPKVSLTAFAKGVAYFCPCRGVTMINPGQWRSWISAVGLQATHLVLVLAVVCLPALGASPLAQAQFKVLYTFTGGTDGGFPRARVIRDKKGNLYGTATWGGNLTCNSGNGCGVVYKLTKTGIETVLYSFAGGKDGATPSAALIRDAKGNFYSTTAAGGNSGCLNQGCGTIFKVDTKGKETVLYTFTGRTDGGSPSSALIMDKAGNFYGTASIGGNLNCGQYGCGVVYKLSKNGKESVLYSFNGTDGSAPRVDSLAVDTKGNFYGTTQLGGDPTCMCGVVFKLTTTGKETVLHTFTGGATDGSYPLSGVNPDTKGNLYGTAFGGGANGKGIAFTITNRVYNRMWDFGSGSDAASPVAGFTIAGNNKLYSALSTGGTLGSGALVVLDPITKTEKVLHSFNYSIDGGSPAADIFLAQIRNRIFGYGTNSQGGTTQKGAGYGTVWNFR